MPDPNQNGWRSGTDPIQRLLRILTTIVFIAVFTYLSVSPALSIDRLPVIALTVAVVLVLLGYESIVRVPVIGRKDDDDDSD